MAAGLHEGLRSLIAGGAPPGFLIIDDGWQCTDVDAPLREPSMMNQEVMKQLNMPGYGETGDEFIEAELEMLAMGAKNIPQGSALGRPTPFTNPCECWFFHEVSLCLGVTVL